MKKEEILEKNRMDNKEEDEREKKLRLTATIPVLIAFGIASVALVIAELVLLDTEILLYSFALIVDSMICVESWYLLFALKKKIFYVIAPVWTLITVSSVLQVMDVFHTMM